MTETFIRYGQSTGLASCSDDLSGTANVRNLYGLLPVSEIPISEVRRVRIFGFLLETLSPSPQCVRDIRVKPDLLGHSNPRMTRHYSAPDITRLLEDAEKVVKMTHEPVLRVVGR